MTEIYSWALIENGRDELFTQPSSIHNKGLFTYKNIPENTILFSFSNYYPVSKTSLSEAVGFSDVTPNTTLKYINHSCNPNAILTEDGHLISTTYILSENEITIDYANFSVGILWNMNCNCGYQKCRGIINSNIQLRSN